MCPASTPATIFPGLMKPPRPILLPGEPNPVQTLRAAVLRQDLWHVSFLRNGSMYADMSTSRWDVPVGNRGGLCVIALFASRFCILPPQSWYKTFSYDLPFWPQATNPEEVSSHSPDDERCETSGQKKIHGVGVNEEIKGRYPPRARGRAQITLRSPAP